MFAAVAAKTLLRRTCLGGIRFMGSTRHHVNPLQSRLLEPLAPVDWSQHLAQPDLPVHLDVG